MKVNPKVNLKLRARKVFEVCLVLSLMAHLVMFLSFKEFKSRGFDIDESEKTLEMEEIPETEQIKPPPPPAAPSVPVESEDEELMDDITIEDTDVLNFTAFDEAPPPPTEEEEIPDFLPLEDQHKIIGGIEAIQKLIKYPEIAVKAGIQGRVQIKVLVNEQGKPVDFKKIITLGTSGCADAAIAAIKQVRFIPAKQRGRPVKFWMQIPIKFTLGKGGRDL